MVLNWELEDMNIGFGFVIYLLGDFDLLFV